MTYLLNCKWQSDAAVTEKENLNMDIHILITAAKKNQVQHHY